MFIANVHRRQGRWDEALAGHRRAFQLAPRESDKALNLARTYEVLRRYEDAARTWDYAIAIEPTNYGFLIDRGRVFVKWQGALDSLEATLDRMAADIDLGGRATIERVELALFRRRPLDALATLAAARRELFASNDAITMSLLRLRRGQARAMLGEVEKSKLDYDTARVILERAIQATEKAGGDPHHLYADRIARNEVLVRLRSGC
jgi:tetratricopeptide (TPR) repeat protein